MSSRMKRQKLPPQLQHLAPLCRFPAPRPSRCPAHRSPRGPPSPPQPPALWMDQGPQSVWSAWRPCLRSSSCHVVMCAVVRSAATLCRPALCVVATYPSTYASTTARTNCTVPLRHRLHLSLFMHDHKAAVSRSYHG